MFSPSPDEWIAIGLSLRIATVATLVTLPLGIATALLLARGRFPGRSLVDGLVHLPLVLPPVVTGFALLLLFGRRGPIGALLADMGIVLAFRWTGAVLAAAVMAFPLMVRASACPSKRLIRGSKPQPAPSAPAGCGPFCS
jgi:molybdate transport system permease protein